MKSTLATELIDFLNEKEDAWVWVAIGSGLACLIAAAIVSHNTLGLFDFQTGWATFLIWVALLYLVVYGGWSYRDLYSLLRARATTTRGMDTAALRQKLQGILQKPLGGQSWLVEHWGPVEADGSQTISAKLFFTGKILRLINVHYTVSFSAKCKPASNPAESRFTYWFEYTGTMPWAPPLNDVVREMLTVLQAI